MAASNPVEDETKRLTVFDLGTGGAQLLRTPASAWLFDAGTAYDFEQIITPTLRASGVGQLDNVVVTHGDTEHVEGILSLVQTTPPRRLLDSVLRDRSPTTTPASDMRRVRIP